MLLVTSIEGASRATIEGDELYLEFSPGTKHLRDSLSKTENVKILQEICREVLGRNIGVRFAVKEPDSSDGGPPSELELERQERQRLRALAEENPTVQHALKMFHGEIIDVKKVSH
jgi:hypothetical protein